MNPSLKSWIGLAVFLVICFGAATIGGWFTSSSVNDWFRTLAKPSWNPPNWVFGPVWTVLYATMAIAAWLIWRQHGLPAATAPLTVFLLQLILNVAWSGFFFGLQNPKLAFFEILFLWASILITIVTFANFRALSAWLMVPYLLWVSYAVALNFAIWRLNS
jgi:tryptophan-rich sensory protein